MGRACRCPAHSTPSPSDVRFGWKADIAALGRLGLRGGMLGAGKRVRRREGDVLKIGLGDGRHSYAQVSCDPLIVFFDGAFTDDLPPSRVTGLPVLFRIWVNHNAIKKGIWSIIGNQPLTPENSAEPFSYRQDAITGALSLYHSDFADSGWARPASATECEGLECAAVWGSVHVDDRLRDHYAGRRNKWLESLKIDRRALS